MVLKPVTFTVQSGECVAITGPSGSGKTTLLGLCAGLDQPSGGILSLGGRLLADLDEEMRARLRKQSVGFIFQNFQLLPALTALENVLVPAELAGIRDAEARALSLLTRMGLVDRMHHLPSRLSGGEQQRVALARAFVHRPQIVFADEPTGNLDLETARQVADVMFDLNRTEGTALIIVTHDLNLAKRAGAQIRLGADGSPL